MCVVPSALLYESQQVYRKTHNRFYRYIGPDDLTPENVKT